MEGCSMLVMMLSRTKEVDIKPGQWGFLYYALVLWSRVYQFVQGSCWATTVVVAEKGVWQEKKRRDQ